MSKKRKFILRQSALFIVNCAFWACALWAVQHYLCYVSYVEEPCRNDKTTKMGLTFVNRIDREKAVRYQDIVFRRNGLHFGRIEGMPGDTVHYGNDYYVLPHHCCDNCQASDCQPMAVSVDGNWTWVHRAEIVGTAFPLRYLLHDLRHSLGL